jgi:hypothetical protein
LDQVLTVGVNRILRTYVSSAVLVVDNAVLRIEHPTFRKYGGRFIFWDNLARGTNAALVRALPHATFSLTMSPGGPKTWSWPKALTDGLIRPGTTPAYAIQLAALAGMTPIGVLGVDFNAPDLRRQGAPTHCFADAKREGATGGGQFGGNNLEFYTGANAWARNLGSKVVNLSPFDDSPFTLKSGWSRQTLGAFVEETREAEYGWRASHQHA